MINQGSKCHCQLSCCQKWQGVDSIVPCEIYPLVYSASMKSYHFLNFDFLKIIKGIWTVTLHFVFLVN